MWGGKSVRMNNAMMNLNDYDMEKVFIENQEWKGFNFAHVGSLTANISQTNQTADNKSFN